MGRHGILIFSCLLFVLFEKICSIKSCHFPNHGILIEKTKPDCFLISPPSISLWLFLDQFVHLQAKFTIGFLFCLQHRAYIKVAMQSLQTTLACSRIQEQLKQNPFCQIWQNLSNDLTLKNNFDFHWGTPLDAK